VYKRQLTVKLLNWYTHAHRVERSHDAKGTFTQVNKTGVDTMSSQKNDFSNKMYALKIKRVKLTNEMTVHTHFVYI